MLELYRRHPVGPARSTSAAPARRRAVIRLRDARVASLLGVEVPIGRQRAVLTALGFGVADADDGLDVSVPHWRRLRRHARGRPDRGGRAAGGARRPARHAARADRRRRHADLGPAGAPSCRGRARRARPARDRRLVVRRADAGRPPAAGRRLADAQRRRAGEPDERGARDPAPDAARVAAGRRRATTSPTASPTAPTSPCSTPAPSTGRGWTPSAPPPPTSTTRSACCWSAALEPATWRRPEPPRRRRLRRQGAAGRGARRAARAVGGRGRRREWPFLHPGRSAEIVSGETRLGLLGELHPLVAREWDLEGGAAFAVDLGKRRRAGARGARLPRRDDVPARAADLRRGRRRALRRRRAGHGRGGRRQAAARRLDLRPLRSADGAVSLALHLEFARGRSHADRRRGRTPCATRILARLGEIGVTQRG